jgi:hypothetical protein
MTDQQIQQHRETYERLRALSIPPGYSVWIGGRLVRQSYVEKDHWTWDDAMAAPETPFYARYQRVHGKRALATVGMR